LRGASGDVSIAGSTRDLIVMPVVTQRSPLVRFSASGYHPASDFRRPSRLGGAEDGTFEARKNGGLKSAKPRGETGLCMSARRTAWGLGGSGKLSNAPTDHLVACRMPVVHCLRRPAAAIKGSHPGRTALPPCGDTTGKGQRGAKVTSPAPLLVSRLCLISRRTLNVVDAK
jgi:hypothetical protein